MTVDDGGEARWMEGEIKIVVLMWRGEMDLRRFFITTKGAVV